MTSLLSRAYSLDEVARIVVEEGIARFGAVHGGLWRLSPDGARLELVYDKGYLPALRAAVATVAVESPLPIARVLATREPYWIESRAQYARELPTANAETYPIRPSDDTAFFCAPLIVGGEAIGCVAFNYGRSHAYADEERRLIEAVVDQCALALHRAQLIVSGREAREAAERDQLRFRAIFEQSLDGIILTDEAMCIVEANRAACALLRRPPEEIIRHSPIEFMPVEDRAGLGERREQFRKAGVIERQEGRILLPDGTVRLVELSATADVLPGLHMTTFRDIDDRVRAEESLRFLEEASRMFASSLDPAKTLAAVARLAVPRLADWAAIDTLEADESLQRVAIEHIDPAKIAIAHAMQQRRPASMANPTGVALVIRTGQSSLVPRITDEMLVQSLGSDPEYLALVRETGLASLMIVALPVHGTSRGSITFAFAESHRQFGPQDVVFAEELARRAGTAFENALAYDELLAANHAKDLFLGRARNLQSIASELVTIATREDGARVFARSQRQALGATTCALHLLEGDTLRAIALEGVPEATIPKVQVLPLSCEFPGAIACREGRPVWTTTAAALAEARGVVGIKDQGLQAAAALPLLFDGQRLGVIAFGFDTPHAFDDDERAYLTAIANLWAQAIHRVRAVESERDALVRSRSRADRLYRLTSALASSMTTASVIETFREHGARAVSSRSADVTILHASVATSDVPTPALIVARDQKPVFFESTALLPLVSASGQSLGVASFDFGGPTEFGDEARQLLLAVADQCAVAVDRARAYEAEAAALRKKDEFLAMLGHELRNPLAPILTATSLLRMRGVAAERELGILERQGRHLVRLVDDLLDVARVTSGKLTLHRQPIEIGAVVGQALESARKGFEDKRLRVEVDVRAEGLRVDGDRDRLVQVVTNLLVNAAKFTPPHRSVYITATATEADVTLAVRDEGEGIAPDLLPHVFDLFAQGRQALDRREGGLGLGLAIARSIVEAHGGAIEAKSGGRNHGATIAMRLPIARLSSAVSDKVSTTRDRPALATAAPRGRILLVDDNIDGAEMLADYLGALGYETSTAHDGPGALRAVDVVLPHAAVVDIGLPGMDGYELADELRRRLGDRAPALIALTGYAQASDRERALAAGFRAHFAKPVDLDKLAAAVEGIVRDVCRSGTSQE